ncbi:MAG: hypothetical protein IT265_12495 [Saprospiraceae bacterium]|nr:hypothetical protein [Saprospiraceae bacterium]
MIIEIEKNTPLTTLDELLKAGTNVHSNGIEHLNMLYNTILQGLDKDSFNDHFIKRSDSIYIKTEELHKKYFGHNTSHVIKQMLVNQILHHEVVSLIIIGVDSYLITIPDVINELKKNNYRGKIHIAIIDPIREELNLEQLELKAENEILGIIVTVQAKIENLPKGNWQFFANMPGHRIAFANFSLHYVPVNTRNETLKNIRNSTDQLIMIERDLDIFGLTKNRSIIATWNHFVPLYKRIQESDATIEERNILYEWLAMIVRDALNDRINVVCTHLCESIEKWAFRLTSMGFKLNKTVKYLDIGQVPKHGIGIFPIEGTTLKNSGFLGVIITKS